MTRLHTKAEVDARIEEWHTTDTGAVSLHDFLGWTWFEYARYVSDGVIPL